MVNMKIIWFEHCNHEQPLDQVRTVYPKKYAHGFCFAVLCFGYTLTDFPISIRFTSLALWQSNDCPSASKAILMNMDRYFMWIHYERLHNHNKVKHNKTVCIFLGIYCISDPKSIRRKRDRLLSASGWDGVCILYGTSLKLLFDIYVGGLHNLFKSNTASLFILNILTSTDILFRIKTELLAS